MISTKMMSPLESNQAMLAGKIRQIKKLDFLPKINQGRRIMQLDEVEVSTTHNPFQIAPTTERVLALGERTRELDNLNK